MEESRGDDLSPGNLTCFGRKTFAALTCSRTWDVNHIGTRYRGHRRVAIWIGCDSRRRGVGISHDAVRGWCIDIPAGVISSVVRRVTQAKTQSNTYCEPVGSRIVSLLIAIAMIVVTAVVITVMIASVGLMVAAVVSSTVVTTASMSTPAISTAAMPTGLDGPRGEPDCYRRQSNDAEDGAPLPYHS